MKHEESLEDQETVVGRGFETATLQLDTETFRNRQDQLDLDSDGLANGKLDKTDKQTTPPQSAPHRPKSLAVIPWSGDNPKDFFSYRDGLVKSAVEECRAQIMNEEDGALLGAWLLTEISFWDNEKERLVLLTAKSLISVKYDFITLRPLDSRRVPLDQIDTVIIGDLCYPPVSIIPSRNMSGVRAMWNQGKPLPFVKKWNPFERDIPFLTFCSHPLLWHVDDESGERKLYNVDDFQTMLRDALDRRIKTFQVSVQHKEILLENYVGLGSLIHNKTSLGFFKVRGKFSF